jgi:hypothetical protein
MDGKHVALVTGEQFVGKGIRMGADYVDETMKSTAKPLLERPSTWINLLLGLGGVGYAYYRMGKGYASEKEEAALVVGSNILAEKLPDYVIELMAPAATRVSRMPMGQVSARVMPVAQAVRTAGSPNGFVMNGARKEFY